jgi:protein TonB
VYELPPEGLPEKAVFVPREKEPILVKKTQPVYPELARLAGVEGVVLVSALIDKKGKVQNALIEKASGTNVGFEEAALEAAYKNIYSPAINNNQPVAVWITYKVEFTLK